MQPTAPNTLPSVRNFEAGHHRAWEQDIRAVAEVVADRDLSFLVLPREQFLKQDGADQDPKLYEDDPDVKWKHERFLREQKGVKILRTIAIATIPGNILVLHPKHDNNSSNGPRNIPTEEIFSWMRERYARVSPAMHRDAKQFLSRPYDGRPLDQFIGDMAPHLVVPFSPLEQHTFLKEALLANDPTGIYARATTDYYRKRPYVDQHEFGEYGREMFEAYKASQALMPSVTPIPQAFGDALRSDHLPLGSYAAGASSQATGTPSTAEEIAGLKREIAALKAAATRDHRPDRDRRSDRDRRPGHGHSRTDRDRRPTNQTAPGSRTNPDNASPRIPVCRQFARAGTCGYGDSCRFKH